MLRYVADSYIVSTAAPSRLCRPRRLTRANADNPTFKCFLREPNSHFIPVYVLTRRAISRFTVGEACTFVQVTPVWFDFGWHRAWNDAVCVLKRLNGAVIVNKAWRPACVAHVSGTTRSHDCGAGRAAVRALLRGSRHSGQSTESTLQSLTCWLFHYIAINPLLISGKQFDVRYCPSSFNLDIKREFVSLGTCIVSG